ncbi:hypothetical protein C8Q74DRAFT_1251070 [Fomes fomentarius]|nr:hypothetical protein C8Q74DRAFT_1251070 [Fomes fomentarius]
MRTIWFPTRSSPGASPYSPGQSFLKTGRGLQDVQRPEVVLDCPSSLRHWDHT